MGEATLERRVKLLELQLTCTIFALQGVAQASKPSSLRGGDLRKAMEETTARSVGREIAGEMMALLETHTTPETLAAGLAELLTKP